MMKTRLIAVLFIAFTCVYLRPAFAAETPAPPGPTLSLQEVSRSPGGDGTMVEYRLAYDGLPQGKTYRLTVKAVGLTMPVDIDWALNDRAELVGSDGTSIASLRLQAVKYHLGEPYGVDLESTDGSVKLTAEATPFPLTAASGPCHGSMRLFSTTEMGFLLEGFEPNEVLTVTDESSGEAIHRTTQAGPQGAVAIGEYPAVKGKSGGPALLHVVGKNCTLDFNYAWGDALKVQ